MSRPAAHEPVDDSPTPTRVREQYEAAVLAQRPDGYVPASLHDVSDDVIDGVRVRRYVPAQAQPGLAVWVHGGGWSFGSLETADATCRRLAVVAQRAVWSIDYALAPEQPFPAGLHDVETVLDAALHAHAPVLIGGDSAGGNLVAAAVLRRRARGTPLPAVQLLVYPALDATLSTPSARAHGELVESYLAPYLGGRIDRADPSVSPLLASDLTGLPSTVVVTVGHDPLRDEGLRFAQRLRETGVLTVSLHDPALGHGFLDSADLIDAHHQAREVALRAGLHLLTLHGLADGRTF